MNRGSFAGPPTFFSNEETKIGSVHSDFEGVGSDVVDCAVRLHMRLGPGLLESAYTVLLARQLGRRGHLVDRERPVALEFDRIVVPAAFRVDLLVDECVVVEVKSVERLAPVHKKQLLTYLRLLDLPLGYLINFAAPVLKDGLRRVPNFRASMASCLR